MAHTYDLHNLSGVGFNLHVGRSEFLSCGSLNIRQYTAIGIRFTSAQVSSLAHKYWFLVWCSWRQYAKLAIKYTGLGTSGCELSFVDRRYLLALIHIHCCLHYGGCKGPPCIIVVLLVS